MDNVKKKLTFYRLLKTISYLIGFPLLTIMVFFTSTFFMGEDVYGFGAWYGVLLVIGIWFVVTVAQIVFSKFSKNHKARTMFMLAVTIILTLTGALVFDAVAAAKIKDVQEEYKAHENVVVKDYTYQVNWFVTVTTDNESLNDKFLENVDNFLKTYNIEFKSKNYGDENTDLSEFTYNAKDDAYYSPNGMFSDGYIFGIKQAIDILITYHETQEYYKELDKDADNELAAAIKALEEDSSSAWNEYKQTDEYKAAYGTNGEAYKYMLTKDRLNQIISALGRELQVDKSKFNSILAALKVAGMIDDSTHQQLKAWLNNYLNQNLTVDQIVVLLNGLGLFEEPVTEDDLMAIAKDFSFYQSPKTKPIFEFIEDQRLRDYAYAKYYATEHGAKVASVLIGEKTVNDKGETEYGNIGCVTMDSPGLPAYCGYTLDELYQLKADLSYVPTLYPLMAARRFLYVFAVVIGIGYLFFYHFDNKEKEIFATLTVGGK